MLTGEILSRSVARFGERVAVIGQNERLTFDALDRRANRFAHALIAAKLSAGANAGILARNLPDYAAVHFGTARTGHVLVHLSTRYAPAEIAYVLENADVEFLVTEAQFLPAIEAARKKSPRLKSVIALGGVFEALIAGRPETPPDVVLADADPVGMTFTGGTTGFPKGVLVSHRARALTARSAAMACRLDERDVACVATPLFHVAGLYVLFQPAIYAGATTALLEQWNADAFVALVERARVTMAFLVPSQINQLLRWPGFPAARSRLASLRKLTFAGAPMPDPLQAELLAELPELELIQNYGQSEFGSLTWRDHAFARSKLASVGRAGEGMSVDVLRADGTPASPGEIGEIVSRGTQSMIGYHKKPSETRDVFKWADGWGSTGDVGYKDEDGFFYLVDRSKDMIISGGENVFPKEIENVIQDLSAVAECAVFGVPHEDWGEVPKAYIILKPGRSLSEADVVAHCESRLARFKRPRAVAFVDDLPRTAIGKVQKNVLRAPYWQGRNRKI